MVTVMITPSCSLEGMSNLLSTPGAKVLLKNAVLEWRGIQAEKMSGAKMEFDCPFSLMMDACSLVVPVVPSCLDRPLQEVGKVSFACEGAGCSSLTCS